MVHTQRFTATLTPDAELGGYVARAVEVEIASQGATIEDALASLREALELYFEDAQAPVDTPSLVASVDVRLSA